MRKVEWGSTDDLNYARFGFVMQAGTIARHTWRKGLSLTPAIGAAITLFGKLKEPICMVEKQMEYEYHKHKPPILKTPADHQAAKSPKTAPLLLNINGPLSEAVLKNYLLFPDLPPPIKSGQANPLPTQSIHGILLSIPDAATRILG